MATALGGVHGGGQVHNVGTGNVPNQTNVAPNLHAQGVQPGVPLGGADIVLPPLPHVPPAVAPAAKRPTVPADAQATLREVVDVFRNQGHNAGTGLRLVTVGGQPQLEIRDPAKTTNPFTTRKDQKHQDATAFIKQLVTSELGGDAALADKILKRAGCEGPKIKLARLDGLLAKVEAAKAGQTYAAGHVQKQNALADGQLHLNDPGVTHKVSGDGTGGVLFATKSVPGQPDQGVVIKIERDPEGNKAASFVSDLANHVFSRTTVKPPFDMMRMELVPLPQDSPQRAELADALGELEQNAPNQRTQDKAKEYRANLDGLTHVAKYELLHGTDLSKLPADQRVALVKDAEFARRVGAAAVMMALFGLNDHLGMASGGGSNFNCSNVKLGDDGRFKMIDLSSNAFQGKLGFMDDELKRGFDNLAKFLSSAAKQGADTTLRQVTRDLGDVNPDQSFDKVLLSMLHTNYGGDTLLHGTEGVDAADMKKFYANLIMGSLDGLEFVRANITNFADAHQQQAGTSRVTDPDGTFGHIAARIDALDLDKLRPKLTAQLSAHL